MVEDVRIAPVASVAGAVAAVLGDGGDLWRSAEESGWFQVARHRLSNEGGYVGSALAGLGGARIVGGGADLLALAQGLAQAPRSDQPPARSVAWVDWAPPEGMVERCALAAISWRPSSAFEAWGTTGHIQGLLEDMAAKARTRLRDIDAERFAAAYLLRRLLAGVVNSDELDMYDSPERTAYTPDRRPTWELQRTTPRLVDVVALGWASLGAPERAEDILRDRIEQAVHAGTDPDAVADAQAALVRLFREYRIDPSSWSLGDIKATGLAEVEQAVRLIGEGSKGIRMLRAAARSAQRGVAEPSVVMLGHVIPTLRRLEIEALDRPESTANELFELARNPSSGQEIRADMAYVLGVLACARAGIPVPEDLREWRMHSEAFGDPARLRGKWASGWTPRLQVARAYALGDEQAARDIASNYPSPELDLALPPVLDLALPPVQAMASARSAPDSPTEGESTVASGIRRLTHVQLKPWKPPPSLLVLSVYTALVYGVILAFVLKLTQLPLWVSLSAGAIVVGPAYVAMRFWESRAGVDETFARRVLFSVEYPGEGPVANLKVSTGSRLYRLRRMSSRAVSFYSAFAGREGRSLGHPATVSLSADADKGERFAPSDWRVPRSTVFSSVLIAELDVPPVLCTLPWERWLAATSRKPNDTFIWIRPSPGWPATIPPRGPPRFAGPDHMANEKVARFVVPPVSGPSSLATAAGADSQHNARLVHVVGMPVQTSAGWRLRVERVGSRREASSSPASPRREGLVAPTDLVTDSAGVVVLQAPPITVGAVPFVVDREGWFAFAVDVLEAGAASVLTVPPLGDVQAEQAVDITTAWALGTPDDLQPENVVRLLKDLSRLVAGVSERGRRPWAQDDVVGFIRLLDEGGSRRPVA